MSNILKKAVLSLLSVVIFASTSVHCVKEKYKNEKFNNKKMESSIKSSDLCASSSSSKLISLISFYGLVMGALSSKEDFDTCYDNFLGEEGFVFCHDNYVDGVARYCGYSKEKKQACDYLHKGSGVLEDLINSHKAMAGYGDEDEVVIITPSFIIARSATKCESKNYEYEKEFRKKNNKNRKNFKRNNKNYKNKKKRRERDKRGYKR
ncbi:hypothetical protein ACFLYA_00525 [Candidatus Dependentiae bacterium]